MSKLVKECRVIDGVEGCTITSPKFSNVTHIAFCFHYRMHVIQAKDVCQTQIQSQNDQLVKISSHICFNAVCSAERTVGQSQWDQNLHTSQMCVCYRVHCIDNPNDRHTYYCIYACHKECVISFTSCTRHE